MVPVSETNTYFFLLFSSVVFFFSYADCQFALFIENSRKASAFDCPACHRPFCRHCSQIWHPDLTCQQTASQRAAQDPTLKMLMNSENGQSGVRPCPRCESSMFALIRISKQNSKENNLWSQ